MSNIGIVGIQNNPDSSSPVVARFGKQGEQMVSELHGRFYEQTYRGNVFGGIKALTSISNATFTVATVDATSTPIVGLWNPASSGVNCVILQATLQVIQTALQHTGPGSMTWFVSTNQSAISTGASPTNRKTFSTVGSATKYMGGVAMTGQVGNVVAAFGSALGPGALSNLSTLDTAIGQAIWAGTSVENFDGSLIVPPGGVLTLLSSTTAVAFSAASGMVWEEVPV